MAVRKSGIIITSLLCVLILVGVMWFQVSKKTTFGELLNQNISEEEVIDRIVLQNRLDLPGGSLWAVIYDQELIDSLLTELSSVSISRQLKNRKVILNNTMSIHTLSKSYYFEFDGNDFTAIGKNYKVVDGSIVSVIRNLENQAEVEWQTDEEFMGIEQ